MPSHKNVKWLDMDHLCLAWQVYWPSIHALGYLHSKLCLHASRHSAFLYTTITAWACCTKHHVHHDIFYIIGYIRLLIIFLASPRRVFYYSSSSFYGSAVTDREEETYRCVVVKVMKVNSPKYCHDIQAQGPILSSSTSERNYESSSKTY
jgi:hypothetical protein